MNEKASSVSKWRALHQADQGSVPPDDVESEWIPYIPWLEAKLAALQQRVEKLEALLETIASLRNVDNMRRIAALAEEEA